MATAETYLRYGFLRPHWLARSAGLPSLSKHGLAKLHNWLQNTSGCGACVSPNSAQCSECEG